MTTVRELEAEVERLEEALQEIQRQSSLWEQSRMDEMGLGSEGTLVVVSDIAVLISDIARAALAAGEVDA
jgi:hypothetical protein